MLFEWDKVENAKKFASSEDLKKTMEQAGVIGIPHIHFLNEVSVSKAWKDLMWQGRPPPQISSGIFFTLVNVVRQVCVYRKIIFAPLGRK